MTSEEPTSTGEDAGCTGEAAEISGTSERTRRRWRNRYDEPAPDGLLDPRVTNTARLNGHRRECIVNQAFRLRNELLVEVVYD